MEWTKLKLLAGVCHIAVFNLGIHTSIVQSIYDVVTAWGFEYCFHPHALK